MDIKQTLSKDSSREVALNVATFAGISDENFAQVFEISKLSPSPINWRGIRALYVLAETSPPSGRFLFPEFITELKNSKNNSYTRSLLKLISYHIVVEHEEYLSYLLDKCFSLLTSSTTEVAIKLYALDILFKITEIEKELKPELAIVLEDILVQESRASLKGFGKKILKKLHKQLKQY
ncbi:MAG: hypothetical protein IPO21_18960 [Bacteroidales bacterium]|nr:hypothetical protein [Bacteroidales bacterium]